MAVEHPERKKDVSTIKVRPFRFKAPADLPRYWYRNDPVLTHAFNAGLIMFPKGEQFFIETVVACSKKIKDPALLADVKAFSAQEAHHSRAHQLHNELLRSQGYDIDGIERDQDRKFAKIKKLLSLKRRLAIVIAYEHFTAMFGDVALKDARWLEGLHPVYADFLRWHAVEELEHKSVAFNVYRQIGGDYFTRAFVMIVAFLAFYNSVLNYFGYFLKKDGIKKRAAILPLLRFMFVSPGSFFQLAPGHIRYFSPWFHPDKTRSSHLIEHWKQHDEAQVAAAHSIATLRES